MPWGEKERHLTSNILPSTTLNPSPTAQRPDKISSLLPLQSETATNTFVFDWSDTRSTTIETIKVTPNYAEADDELSISKLVYQDSQKFSTPCCLNALVVTDNVEPKIGIQSTLEPTGFGIDDGHDVTGSSGVVLYSAMSYKLPIASLLITSTSEWVFGSSYAHSPVAYSSQGTSQEMQSEESQAKAKKIGSYMTGNPKLSSEFVRYSHGHMSSQTVQEKPEASDMGFSKPTPIIINSFLHPTNTEPITTTTRGSIPEEPTMDNTRASRAVPTHIFGLVFGCISGVSVVFAIIFFSHRFCFKRAFRCRRDTDSTPLPKADCVAARHLHVSKNMEVSRFSAYS